MLSRVVCSFFCIIILHGNALAQQWQQWRGVNRDAKISSNGLVDELPGSDVPRLWTAPIGPGYSGPTVANSLVYVTDRGIQGGVENIERVLCFDAKTGKSVWQNQYEAPYEISYTAGPRAAVTIHQGKAFSVGAMGHFLCLNAKSGEVIWQRDLAKDYDARMPIWGITAAPLVYEDIVIQVAAGEGNSCVVALELETGKERWRAIDEKAGYSAPVLIRQAGRDVLVVWTGESVSGLDPSSGRVHWRIEMASRKMPIGVPTPVVSDDLIFVSSFYDGSLLIRFDQKQLSAEKVWRRVGRDEKNTDALHCMISNPIIKGDHIYGADSYGEMRCLDVRNGDRIWEDTSVVPRNRWATVHIIQADDREFIQKRSR